MRLGRGAVIGKDEWLVHDGEECGIVLSGRLEIVFQDERFTLEAEDSLSFPSTRPHRIRNVARGESTALWVITPPSF